MYCTYLHECITLKGGQPLFNYYSFRCVHFCSPTIPFSCLPSTIHAMCRLLSHAFDPDLDKSSPREFIVYACPLGTLGNQLEEYMEQTLYRCGRNGAHKSDPHVTLCQYFLVSNTTFSYPNLFLGFTLIYMHVCQLVTCQVFCTHGYIIYVDVVYRTLISDRL